MEEKYKKAQAKIAEIVKKCGHGDCIFRGESDNSNEKIASNFYREYATNDQFDVSIEKDIIIKEARVHFPIKTPNIEILTKLQHYDGKTSLIDFTKDLHIALFFACSGNKDKPGRVITLKTINLREERNADGATKLKEDQNITYREKEDYVLISPHSRETRIVFQSSVFVHARNGYIQDEDAIIIEVEKEIKDEMLDYLREYFNIHIKTVYNDIYGFIKEQKTHPKKIKEDFLKSILKFKEGKWTEAKKYINTVINLNPQHANAYLLRGVTNIMTGKYKEAIKDFERSMEINPENADVYYWRGMAKLNTAEHEGAIDDLNKVIEMNRGNILAYGLRAAVNEELNNYDEALADYEKVLELAGQDEKIRKATEERIKQIRRERGGTMKNETEE